jgi:hypothetical protein
MPGSNGPVEKGTFVIESDHADQSRKVLKGAESPLDSSVIDDFAAGAHHSLASVVASLDPSPFIWDGVRMDTDDVLRVYMHDMASLYEQLTRGQGENGHADGVRYGLYEELAGNDRVA